jgi:hypothetical protein
MECQNLPTRELLSSISLALLRLTRRITEIIESLCCDQPTRCCSIRCRTPWQSGRDSPFHEEGGEGKDLPAHIGYIEWMRVWRMRREQEKPKSYINNWNISSSDHMVKEFSSWLTYEGVLEAQLRLWILTETEPLNIINARTGEGASEAWSKLAGRSL